MHSLPKSYVEWDHLALIIGMVPMHKQTVSELFDSIEDERLKGMAVRAAGRFKGQLLLLNGKSDLDTFLAFMRMRMQKSGFPFSESMEDGEVRLTVQHGMDRKWSLLFSEYHKKIIEDLGYRAETEIRESLWVVRITEREQE